MPYRVIPGGASSSRVYLVDGGGNGDFQTVQAAINAAHEQEPTSEERWLVLVGPGVYDESLTLYDYVDVSGLAPGPAAIIQAPEGQYAVATPASCWLSNLRLSGGTDPVLLLNAAGIELVLDTLVIAESDPGVAALKITADCTLRLRNCDIQAGGVALRMAAGTARLYDSRLCHSHGDAGAATEQALLLEAGTFLAERCAVENTSPAGSAVKFSANPTQARLLHCSLRKASGSYAVEASAACPNASVVGCALNGTVHANVGVSVGNDVDASV
jgi:hypothetical protein